MVEPLHLQDSLSKIPLVQKIHDSSRVIPEVTKEQIKEQIKQDASKKATTTKESKQGGKVEIRDEDRNRNRRKKKRKFRKSGNSPEDNTEKLESKMGQLIDITV